LSYAKKLGKKFSLEEFTAMLLLSVNNIDNDLEANPTFSTFYPKNMGSGRVDALKMLLNVEGTPCVSIQRGSLVQIDLQPYLGDGDLDLKILDNLDTASIISEEDKARIGVSSGPRIYGGKLIITCDKIGHATINVSCIVGGDKAGADDSMGGRVTTKRLAIIVRDSHAANGGWM
jgi:hypothetical protein